jgi:hypothetical protein
MVLNWAALWITLLLQADGFMVTLFSNYGDAVDLVVDHAVHDHC